VATVAAIGVALFRWKPTRIQVQGASMVPTLMPGDWALAVTRRRFRRGGVAVVEHPGRPGYEMVKRITGLPNERVGERLLGDDEYWVEGDREDASTDSRHFGPVLRDQVKAKVLLVYWPKERRHRIKGSVTTSARR
jgi:nickel-type superoxide dismutase maturation protease